MPEKLKESGTFGMVIFYNPDYKTKTLKEVGRTARKPAAEALNIFAEVPNPASQIIFFNDDVQEAEQLALLDKLTHDEKWLNDLFECI